MSKPIPRLCPNCGQHPVANHPATGCVLAALIDLIRDRGTKSDMQIYKLHARCNADAMWGRIGPVIDDLEDGKFTS
jgi:hypothetical protein